MAYTKYSLTPANNTAAPPDGAPEGMLPSAVNDTMRDMMAQIRDCGDGIRDGTYTMTAPKITGGTITGAAFTGNTFTSPVISGGTINNATIGATTATTGKFTTLEATGATTFSGATVVSASLTANTFSSSGATITGGSVTGITDLAIADGGTGASTAAGARTNLGLDGFVNMKNRIINGAMVIDQRNAGASVTQGTANTYTLDRWVCAGAVASKFTVQQSSTAPAGFTNSALLTSSSAYSITSGDYYYFAQSIEGFNVADLNWGTANAKTVTLSFWVRSSLTGTFGGALSNQAQNRSYPFTYTISSANTWEQKSITVTGDTTGTWLTTNNVGIQVWIGLGVGSTLSGTAGAWAGANYISATGATSVVGTNGATFYITGVQLEVGSTATSFDYRPYTTELGLCYRYFWRQTFTADAPFSIAVASSSTGMRGCIQFPVPMRTNPTWSVGTISQLIGQSNSTNYTASAYSILGSSTNGVYFSLTSSGMTGGMALSLTQNADINSQWSAEL